MGWSKEQISELCGAIMGDGWIQENERGFFITGDPINDKEYYDSHITKLINRILSIITKPKNFPYWKVYGISLYKQNLIKKLLSFGLAKGKKVNSAYIPDWIYNSFDNRLHLAFIRGVFDTDGCIFFQKDYTKYANNFNSKYHCKIRLRITSISKTLIDQIYGLCKKFNIRCIIRKLNGGYSHNRNRSDVYILEINELKSIHRWFNELKPSNPKHTTKYEVWQKFGFCPPHTTLKQRRDILKNQLNPYNLYAQG